MPWRRGSGSLLRLRKGLGERHVHGGTGSSASSQWWRVNGASTSVRCAALRTNQAGGPQAVSTSSASAARRATCARRCRMQARTCSLRACDVPSQAQAAASS